MTTNKHEVAGGGEILFCHPDPEASEGEGSPERGAAGGGEILRYAQDDGVVRDDGVGGVEHPPFEIPPSWVWTRLGEAFDVRDGTHDTPKYTNTGVPLVTSKHLNAGKIDFSNVKFISEEDHLAISKRSNVQVNDILFAMIGSIGNPALVQENKTFSIKNVALFKG
ncbi:MAG: hypothetical protein ACK5T0_05780, partial [Vampirovibrionales bacterium]